MARAKKPKMIRERVKERVGPDVWDFRAQGWALSEVVNELMLVLDEDRKAAKPPEGPGARRKP